LIIIRESRKDTFKKKINAEPETKTNKGSPIMGAEKKKNAQKMP